jgi:hypothetical protein
VTQPTPRPFDFTTPDSLPLMRSLPPIPVPDDLAALCSALVDGVITPEQVATLEEMLRADLATRDAFRHYMRVESILAWELAEQPAQLIHESMGQADERKRSHIHLRADEPSARRLIPGVAAAVAILGGLAWLLPLRPPAEAEPRPVCRLVDSAGARFNDGRVALAGESLPEGPFELIAGSAQIAFDSGAVVAITAPAEVEILGRNRLFVRSGRVTPFVPPAAKGFTVISPSGEVVDLGTEFTVNVDARGRAAVYVVDGEVDVAAGHGPRPAPLRMTQGFGTRLDAAENGMAFTERPLVIDHFDAAGGPLRLREFDAHERAVVAGGELRIPMRHTATGDGRVRILLDHDLSQIVGRRSTISYKVTLPATGFTSTNRWLACSIDAGDAAPAMAYEIGAAVAVLTSPHWHAGVRISGEPVKETRVFARGDDAIGPYQVMISIDDTPEARASHGTAVVDVFVNGLCVVSDHPFPLPARPRLSLQTHVINKGDRGFALVDDFSVSVADER